MGVVPSARQASPYYWRDGMAAATALMRTAGRLRSGHPFPRRVCNVEPNHLRSEGDGRMAQEIPPTGIELPAGSPAASELREWIAGLVGTEPFVVELSSI